MNWAIALKTIGAVVHFRIAQKSPIFDKNVQNHKKYREKHDFWAQI